MGVWVRESGTGVAVGVAVGVTVGDGVEVGVEVAVAVGVYVGVEVGVDVCVGVAVGGGVDVGEATTPERGAQPTPPTRIRNPINTLRNKESLSLFPIRYSQFLILPPILPEGQRQRPVGDRTVGQG